MEHMRYRRHQRRQECWGSALRWRRLLRAAGEGVSRAACERTTRKPLHSGGCQGFRVPQGPSTL
eukprot:1461548-Alexandrium_andersonii.AAC.1